jgi:tetratricopeptide (TPR) repeat protein
MVRGDGRLIRLAVFVTMLAIVVTGCTGTGSGTSADGVTGEEQARADAVEGLTGASQALLQQSQYQQDMGDYPQAAASLERALRIDASSPLLWIELGRVRLTEGDYQQAEQIGRRAQSLAAGNEFLESESLQLVVDALRSQGRYLEARELAFGDY